MQGLIDAGVITEFRAHINADSLGYGGMVIVGAVLERSTPKSFTEFEAAIARFPFVLECQCVAGDFDYLIKARVADMAAYREFLGDTLLTLPGVHESTSYVVMEQVKETLALSVPY